MYISLALCCVVPETSLKPEEALIYLYDGCMVRMSYLYNLWEVYGASCYLRRQPGYRTRRLEPLLSLD